MDSDLLKADDYDENNKRYEKIRIVVVSENHQMIQISDGDILSHRGGFTNRHHWFNLSNNEIPQSIIEFNQWLEELSHQYQLVICGNHEISW